MSEQLTLGKALFPSLSRIYDYFPADNDHVAYPIVAARRFHRVTAALFALKIHRFTDDAGAEMLEGIFQDLQDFRLSERIQEWCANKDTFSKEPYSSGLVRQYREALGNIALDVFFEAVVFEGSWEKLRLYLQQPINLANVHTTYTDEAAAETKQAMADFYPEKLLNFVRYMATASPKTKNGHSSRIRKFLKGVLDDPVRALVSDCRSKPIANIPISVSSWSTNARYEIANALVANGMYEECIEYDLPEAILPLKLKFLGSAFTETDDDLTAVSHTGSTMSSELAMKKACEDREWRHIWSVLSTMEYKHGQAHFLNIVDPTDIHPQNQGKISPKLALVFKTGFEDGLQGF